MLRLRTEGLAFRGVVGRGKSAKVQNGKMEKAKCCSLLGIKARLTLILLKILKGNLSSCLSRCLPSSRCQVSGC